MESLLIYITLFCTVIISGLVVFAFKISGKTLKLILSFSGAFLFAISVLHLIPDVYERGNSNAGVYILVGFFLQILMEYFSEGIEHGHIHVHHDDKKANFPVTMMAALSIHSFLEGMPLAQNYAANDSLVRSLLFGITLHNIPISIALMSMLMQCDLKKKTAFLWLCVFALMTPLGTLSAQLIGHNISDGIDLSHYFNNIMAVVIGIFLHISTTILFESSENHRFNFIKFIAIIAGALLAFISS